MTKALIILPRLPFPQPRNIKAGLTTIRLNVLLPKIHYLAPEISRETLGIIHLPQLDTVRIIQRNDPR